MCVKLQKYDFLGCFFWAPEEPPLCEILKLEYDNKAGGRLPAVIWFPLAHGPHLYLKTLLVELPLDAQKYFLFARRKTFEKGQFDKSAIFAENARD